MSAPPVLTELKLSEDMKQAVNTAFERLKPVVISYVDENHAPQLSFRGSTQAYSDTALAIWVRNPDGRILDAVRSNPAVALIYGSFEPTARDFMIFRGKARIDTNEAARRRVYESAHPFERDKDKDRKGSAMIVELDSVEGFFGGALLKMKR
jgi:pyridoxamine 5'-phosphate oxidase-like protein